MGRFRAIFYDAGRTLVTPRPQAHDVWEFLSGQLGVDIARGQKLPDVGHFFYVRLGQDGLGAYDSDERARSFWCEYYIHAMQDAGVDMAREQLASAANALYDWYQRPEQWQPYPDVLETLSAAHERRLLQGVVSDWGTDLVSLLHAHELTRYLDFVVASAAVRSGKPHPDIFRYALDRAGLPASDVIYVGDSYISDVLGARALGISAVLLDREGRAPPVDCAVVTSLLDLLKLVED
jgi:REG-2-like HAD superfamily hydrolase